MGLADKDKIIVCGVTYTFTSNYGSCLQAYALQSAIEKMCVQGKRIAYKLLPISKCPGYPLGDARDIKSLLKNIVNTHNRKKFVDFESKHIHYASLYPMSQLEELNNEADAFVCGSDVIWNPKFNHGVNAYYLNFAKKYAFSYAASFGQSDIEANNDSSIRVMLNELDGISVRENRSAEIAKAYGADDVSVVVDPVLLLNRSEWEQLLPAGGDNSNKEKYILVYSVNASGTLKNFVKKLSRQTGMKVIYSAGNAGSAIKLKIWNVQTPQEWLQLVCNASYVVTDSFHGTAFSVIFHKNLFTIVEGKANQGFNVRMNDFLSRVGLEDRIYTQVPEMIDCKDVDYRKQTFFLKKRSNPLGIISRGISKKQLNNKNNGRLM